MKLNYLSQAIELATDSAQKEGCGPFGAVIVRGDVLIGSGHNQVTLLNDPTAHAEVQAIRHACEQLGVYSLEGCTLYSSCEPCPMCMGAILWSRVEAVYFAADRYMAASHGFDDEQFYQELNKPHSAKTITMQHISIETADKPFLAWDNNNDKQHY